MPVTDRLPKPRRGARSKSAIPQASTATAEGGNAFKITYEADGKVLARYGASTARVPIIVGPRMSGKSVRSIIKLYQNALGQKPSSDGWIYRRTIIARSTYGELEHTTIKSWRQWFKPSIWGDIKLTHPPVHHIVKYPLNWEVIFIALDKAEHVQKLNSMEASDAWVNEGWQVAREVITGLVLTTDRYPNPRSPEGCHMPQVLVDTNGPPLGHWINYMAGLESVPAAMGQAERDQYTLPAGWEIFLQPPGLTEVRDEGGALSGYEVNPEAENTKWRSATYYTDALAGATPEFVNRYLMGRPGGAADGDRVWHQFNGGLHEAKQPLLLVPGQPVIVGMDFGRTPAVVVCQKPFDLYWRVLAEIEGMVTSAREFMDDWVLPYLGRLLEQAGGDDWEVMLYCDPAGEHHSEANDTTPVREIRAAAGSRVRIVPAHWAKDFTVRRDTMNALFRQQVDGRQALMIDPGCKALLRAARGGYCYPRQMRQGGNEIFVADRPDKRNPNTHIANALEYAICGHDRGALVLSPTGGGQMRPVGVSRSPGYFARVAQERRLAASPVIMGSGGGFFSRRRGR